MSSIREYRVQEQTYNHSVLHFNFNSTTLFILNFTGDDSEDDSPQTLDEILRQIPPSHTSPQVQDMIEESQRHQDRELIQERDSLFSQPQATQTSTVFDSSEEVFKEILMFQITKYGKKTTLFITTCGAVAFFSNIFGKF